MDLKINREMLSVSEKIYDGVQEQSVELDYILPDYYPDIFKLIKCCIAPTIISSNINGDSLTYELLADVKILYCSEKDNKLQCINQKKPDTGSGMETRSACVQKNGFFSGFPIEKFPRHVTLWQLKRGGTVDASFYSDSDCFNRPFIRR